MPENDDVEFDLDDYQPDPTEAAAAPDEPSDAELAEFAAENPADPAIEGTEGLA